MIHRSLTCLVRKVGGRRYSIYVLFAVFAFFVGLAAFVLWPLHISHGYGVNLLTLSHDKDKAVLALENNTVKLIYISVCVCCETGTHYNSQPVVYDLLHQALDSNSYESVGPNFHSCLDVRSVRPGERVQFESYLWPEEGKYQVKVRYLDDPEIVQMFKSQSDITKPNFSLTDAEHERVMKSWKEVRSDVPRGER